MDKLSSNLFVNLPLSHRRRCLGQHFLVFDFFLNDKAGVCWLSSANLALSNASVSFRLILILFRFGPSIVFNRQLGEWLPLLLTFV